jgi:hypothetical protein
MPVVEIPLFIPGKLFTLNGERKGNKYERASRVRLWRQAAWGIARMDRDRPRHLTSVEIEACPVLGSRRSQDTAGCFPVVKAAIDGLVDAHLLEHDGPDIVRKLTFCAPEHATIGGEGLRLIIRGEAA